jgi:hypothetical protein
MEDNNPNKCRRKLLKTIAVGKSLPESCRRQFTINFRDLPLEPFKGISAIITRLNVYKHPLQTFGFIPLMIDSKSPCLNTAIVHLILFITQSTLIQRRYYEFNSNT